MELADTSNLRFDDFGHTGSTPVEGTKGIKMATFDKDCIILDSGKSIYAHALIVGIAAKKVRANEA